MSGAAAHKAYRDRLTDEAVAAYGGACTCCGEVTRAFLTLDHVNDDGAAHRAAVLGATRHSRGGGHHMARWAKKHGHPDVLTVLCWNCNSGRARNGGICPHQETQ